MRDVAGKVAVITGGASGIGRGMAEVFAAAGMKIVLADVDEARVTETARALEKSGAEVLAVGTDVSKQSDVDALARRALDSFGAVHVVCNNAGVAHGGIPTWESTLHDWEWIVGVNLMGVVHGVRTFTPILLEEGEGHIVNTASMAGLISPAGNALYGVTKHAVVALSEALFNELAALNKDVHVSVLCPGWIATEILRSSERNQPEAVRHSRPAQVRITPEGEIRRKQVESLLAGGLSPNKVGELVLAAIRHRLENVLEERAPTPANPVRR